MINNIMKLQDIDFKLIEEQGRTAYKDGQELDACPGALGLILL